MNVSYQKETDLPALEVTDDDMIWVIKEEANQNDMLVWSEISWQQIERIISNRHRLTSYRSSRWWYDLSYTKGAMN